MHLCKSPADISRIAHFQGAVLPWIIGVLPLPDLSVWICDGLVRLSPQRSHIFQTEIHFIFLSANQCQNHCKNQSKVNKVYNLGRLKSEL